MHQFGRRRRPRAQRVTGVIGNVIYALDKSNPDTDKDKEVPGDIREVETTNLIRKASEALNHEAAIFANDRTLAAGTQIEFTATVARIEQQLIELDPDAAGHEQAYTRYLELKEAMRRAACNVLELDMHWIEPNAKVKISAFLAGNAAAIVFDAALTKQLSPLLGGRPSPFNQSQIEEMLRKLLADCDHQKRSNDLKKEVASLKELNKSETERRKSAESNCKKLEQRVELAKSGADSDAVTARDTITSLGSRLKQAKATIAEESVANVANKLKVESLGTEVSQLKTQLGSTTELQEKVRLAELADANHKKGYQALLSRYESKLELHSGTVNTLMKIQGDCHSLKKENDSLRSKIKDAESARIELNKIVLELNNRVEASNLESNNHQATVAQLERTCTSTDFQLKAVRREAALAGEQAKKAMPTLVYHLKTGYDDALNERTQRLEEEHEAAMSRIRDQHAITIGDLEKDHALEVQRTKAAYDKQHADKVDALKTDHDKEFYEAKEAYDELDDRWSASFSNLKSDRDAAVEKVGALGNKIEQLEMAAVDLGQRHEETIAGLRQTISTLESDVAIVGVAIRHQLWERNRVARADAAFERRRRGLQRAAELFGPWPERRDDRDEN